MLVNIVVLTRWDGKLFYVMHVIIEMVVAFFCFMLCFLIIPVIFQSASHDMFPHHLKRCISLIFYVKFWLKLLTLWAKQKLFTVQTASCKLNGECWLIKSVCYSSVFSYDSFNANTRIRIHKALFTLWAWSYSNMMITR